MQLMEVDKTRYRKHTNIVIAVFVASFAVLSLVFGSLLITAFGAESATASGSTGNFHLNAIGVFAALFVCTGVLHSLRHQPLLVEVYYMWQLKMLHNRIYRKLAKIKRLADEDDLNSLIILTFYYASLKQVYQLDDNTLTLSTLAKDTHELELKIEKLGLSIDAAQFDVAMLDAL